MHGRRSNSDYGTDYAKRYGVVLESFPEVAPKTKYPWHLWCDGRPWTIERGRHFHAARCTGMRSTLYDRARKTGTTVQVRLGRPAYCEDRGAIVMEREDLFITFQFESVERVERERPLTAVGGTEARTAP